jgi:hypothetical protein
MQPSVSVILRHRSTLQQQVLQAGAAGEDRDLLQRREAVAPGVEMLQCASIALRQASARACLPMMR